ncbi:hypothetical protein LTR95_013058 [Oleoguttula sp. CCFEE 5521]
MTSFVTALESYGIKVNVKAASVSSARDTSPPELNGAFQRLTASAQRSGIILVLLDNPKKNVAEHTGVKRWAEQTVGVVTVCITRGAFTNPKMSQTPAFKANVALKFNAKLGGRNHSVPAATKSGAGNTIVLGADVTHPRIGAMPHCPSIAAVVSSVDPELTNYLGSMRVQKSKQEEIADLAGMVEQRLIAYHQRNGSLPDNLLFYRDGVSDSQFDMVKTNELPKIEAGCVQADNRLQQDIYRPKITLIVCGKRHHTRFCWTEDTDPKTWMCDRSSNFVPGLVVDDRIIRNPYTQDFYLQSHAALKGTARPCHYFVIHNGMNLSVNELQERTFALCWVFATALTPISYAAPAYYADRLCERRRRYLMPLLNAKSSYLSSTDLLNGFDNSTYKPDNAPNDWHLDPQWRDAKDHYACDRVAQNVIGGLWTGCNRGLPVHANLQDKMFYI